MITDYASLQAAVLDWLNRPDLTALAPTLIQLAEDNLADDTRVRSSSGLTTFDITADGDQLPADFGEIHRWYHDGPMYYGAIEVVPDLGAIKGHYGLAAAGVPRYVMIEDGKAYYAPAPTDTYATKLVYRRKLVPLSDAAPTNWLLTEHPRIYLYAALIEAAPYLKDDNRLPMWDSVLEKQLTLMQRRFASGDYSGGTVKRFHRPIG